MAYTDLTKLQDIEPLNINFQNLTDTQTAVEALRTTASAEMGNIWFIAGIILLFLMFIWWFYRVDKTFAYDMTRSIMISSSWCFLISTY
jgi:cbb3-type cytochrome oxidase subunit 3